MDRNQDQFLSPQEYTELSKAVASGQTVSAVIAGKLPAFCKSLGLPDTETNRITETVNAKRPISADLWQTVNQGIYANSYAHFASSQPVNVR